MYQKSGFHVRHILMDVVNSPSVLGSIRFLTGPLAGTTYQITKPVIRIGREPGNDISISDPSVSRHHAQLTWNNGAWSIQKLAAQNTLTINQREVQQSPLHDRDTVVVGQGTTFLFQVAAQAASAGQRAAYPPPASQSMQQQAFPAQPYQQSMPPMPATPPAYAPGNAAVSFQGIAPAPVPPPMMAPDAGTQRAIIGTDGSPTAGSLGGIPSLEVSTNTDHEKHVYQLPPTQQVFDIGRDPSNTIVINRPTVSSFHAQIIRDGNQLVLVHPHPARGRTLNGLTYQGRVIRGDEPFRKVLARGDVFRITDENGTFVSLAYNDGSGLNQEAVPELRPIPLGAPLLTLGRATDNMVVLDHPQVSSHHARLEQIQGGYRIVDLGSTNHVYVNTQRVTHQDLRPGDVVRIGPFKLTYTGTQLTQQDESNGIRIDALHLKKHGNRNVILLNDISFAIPPRKFVALVGGSGAGKSTLMDALNGLRPAQEGVVLYNGQDYYRHLAAFSTQLGYVPQDDIIHRDLTVERALYYAAKLRLPDDFTEKQIKDRIEEVLDDVEMKFRRHLLVSKLSGGQRKRVSIALELLANPSVFFLDEPTSGLDPGLDRKMMLLLRRLADKGHTIVLVTHATNNINACDYICFLCQGGNVAYFGPPNEAKTYFGKTDFAEIYSSLEPSEENPNVPTEAATRFKQSPDFQRYVVESLNKGPASQANPQMETASIKPPKRGNPWKQFFILSMRYLELLVNDRVNLIILLLQAPIIGLVLFLMTGPGTFDLTSIAQCPVQNPTTGQNIVDCRIVINILKGPQGPQIEQAQGGKSPATLVDQAILLGASKGITGFDAQKTLLLMAFSAIMFGSINGAREIVKESAIYRRERAVNLGIAPYIFSKFVVLGLLSMLQSLVMVVLVNMRSHFQNSLLFDPFLEIYITMALTAIAGLMTGLLISAIVPNNDRAMSLVPLPLIGQVIFAGVIFSLDKPPALQYIAAFFPARWALAAMGSSVGLHGNILGADSFSYVTTLYNDFVPGIKAASVEHLLICWGALAAMIVIQGIGIAWFLKRKDVRV